MKIQPKQEHELNRFSLLPDGTHPFTVLTSCERPSKSEKNKGRMMFEVKLNVHGPDGDRHVYDYFADWFSEWKLKHFCDTTGQAEAYSSGAVDANGNAWAGKTGYVEIKTEPAKGNFSAKSVVEDYIVKQAAPASPAAPSDDDQVPF